MELRTLATFLKVAELKSFSKAADKLGYSQSAVTMQVQQLERELGARLFDRVPRGALLTQQGRTFALHAREVLAAADQAAASVQTADPSAPEQATGTLRIGTVESVSTALLPELLVRFHARCPRVELVVRTARRDQLVEGLRDGSLDVVITMEEKFSAAGLARTVLREEEIVFVAPSGMGLPADVVGSDATELGSKFGPGTVEPDAASVAFCPPLSLRDLVKLPFVLTERGESYRLALDRLLAEEDEELVPIVEAGNTETLVHLAERGVGCSFLPRFSVEAALAAGALELLCVNAPPVRMTSQLFVHRSKWITPQLSVFIALAKELFA